MRLGVLLVLAGGLMGCGSEGGGDGDSDSDTDTDSGTDTGDSDSDTDGDTDTDTDSNTDTDTGTEPCTPEDRSCHAGVLHYCPDDEPIELTCLVACSGDPAACDPVTAVTPASGEVTVPDEPLLWGFSASAGESLRFDLHPVDAGMDVWLGLCDADARRCDFVNNFGFTDVGFEDDDEVLDYDFDADGDYIVLVGEVWGATGSLRLTVSPL